MGLFWARHKIQGHKTNGDEKKEKWTYSIGIGAVKSITVMAAQSRRSQRVLFPGLFHLLSVGMINTKLTTVERNMFLHFDQSSRGPSIFSAVPFGEKHVAFRLD